MRRLPASCRSGGMPQDIRISPDGKIFYVADMMADGVLRRRRRRRFKRDRLHPDRHRHARPLSRAATARSSTSPTAARNTIHGPPQRQGQRVGDRLRDRARSTPPGRSPAAAAPTWATSAPTARAVAVAAATTTSSTRIDTDDAAPSTKIPVGKEPHGLTVWPQPGRYSLGHTGNMR